jgi:hypothetical protein
VRAGAGLPEPLARCRHAGAARTLAAGGLPSHLRQHRHLVGHHGLAPTGRKGRGRLPLPLHRGSARFSQRATVREAIERLQLTPVLFELGARPHPPRGLYRAYLEQSHVFVGLYSQRYGWVGPGETLSGLEDEYAGVPVRPCRRR